eukprot:3485240-Pyramimonas_sp.AAC.1
MEIVGAVNETMFLKLCDSGALQNGDVRHKYKQLATVPCQRNMFLKICDSGALQNGDVGNACAKIVDDALSTKPCQDGNTGNEFGKSATLLSVNGKRD